MLSAVCFSLDQSKILSTGNGFKGWLGRGHPCRNMNISPNEIMLTVNQSRDR